MTQKHFFVNVMLGRLGTAQKLSPEVMAAYRSAHPTVADRMGIAQFPRMIRIRCTKWWFRAETDAATVDG